MYRKKVNMTMQRRSIPPIAAAIAVLIVLLGSAPLTQAQVYGYQHTAATQIITRGTIFDQIGGMLNNLTSPFNINPLAPANPQASPTAATPSVKIADVRASSQGQSNANQQVTVTLQNGNVAVNDVRVSVFYSTTAGGTTSSNSTVVSLSKGETRAIQFSPNDLAPGSYGVSVVAFKDGTDPTNKATPPYDMRENAVTISVTPTSTAAPTDTATEAQNNLNGFGDILSQFNSWIIFIIAITALITIALFFVFSQNKSGEDRFEADHFKDEYPPGDADQKKISPIGPLSPPSTGRVPKELPDRIARPRRRQIAIDTAEHDEYAQKQPHNAIHPAPTDRGFDSDGFVVGDVSSQKALRDKMRGKKGA
ncbi:MAG: hypothetical protein ACXV3U_03020 [Halobacteriota archaeon]